MVVSGGAREHEDTAPDDPADAQHEQVVRVEIFAQGGGDGCPSGTRGPGRAWSTGRRRAAARRRRRDAASLARPRMCLRPHHPGPVAPRCGGSGALHAFRMKITPGSSPRTELCGIRVSNKNRQIGDVIKRFCDRLIIRLVKFRFLRNQRRTCDRREDINTRQRGFDSRRVQHTRRRRWTAGASRRRRCSARPRRCSSRPHAPSRPSSRPRKPPASPSSR